MPAKYQVNERIYVPSVKIEGMKDYPFAFYETKVVDQRERSIKIDLPRGRSAWIASRLVHKNIGILLVLIGDLSTESTLLEPLNKSILQFCRLLMNDDVVANFRVRSLKELEKIWDTYEGAYSHVIFVCHGSSGGICFHNDGWVPASVLKKVIDKPGVSKKRFLSLGCNTGYKGFGGEFSKFDCCDSLIAPFHSIHGAIASQFCQTFLIHHMIEGSVSVTAFKNAAKSIPGTVNFRLWKNGRLEAGKK